MPQFDFAQNLVPQLVWLAFFFAILYFGIVRTTLPRLAGLMDERDGKVTGDIDAADKAKSEADRIHHAYAAEMADAHATAHAAIADAKAQAVRETEAKLAAANKGLEARQDQAFAALEAAQARSIGDLEGLVVKATIETLERLTGTRPKDADIIRTAAHAAMAA